MLPAISVAVQPPEHRDLSQLAREGRIAVVDSFTLDAPKTKLLAQKVKSMGYENVLNVTDSMDENLLLSARNLPNVNVCAAAYADPVSLIRRPAVPVMIKLRAKTRWLAMDAGLRALKAQGKISDYTIDPRPQSELDAEGAEKAKLAAKRVAGAKAVAEEEEEEA